MSIFQHGKRVKKEPTKPQTIPTQANEPTLIPLKNRRRPALTALGLALIAVSALGSWWLINQVSTTHKIIVAAKEISTGQTITNEDLRIIEANIPNNAATLPGNKTTDLIGQRATKNISENSIISPSDISPDIFPSTGEAIVGIRLQPGQSPAQNLQPGDTIQIIGTPGENEEAPAGEVPIIQAKIQSITSNTNDGSIILDVKVDQNNAPALASLAATSRIAVILISPKG